MKTEKQIEIKKSWGRETLKFKLDKKNPTSEMAINFCKGEVCNEKDKNGEGRNKSPKGQECDRCYTEAFKHLRFRPISEAPRFDAQFLTRLSNR